MSFDVQTKKPKLVEKKLMKFFEEKLKPQIQEELLKQEPKQKWYIKLGGNCFEFMKEYYGVLIIIILLLILLYVRYIEVNKKKNKIKNLVNNNEIAIKKLKELDL